MCIQRQYDALTTMQKRLHQIPKRGWGCNITSAARPYSICWIQLRVRIYLRDDYRRHPKSINTIYLIFVILQVLRFPSDIGLHPLPRNDQPCSFLRTHIHIFRLRRQHTIICERRTILRFSARFGEYGSDRDETGIARSLQVTPGPMLRLSNLTKIL